MARRVNTRFVITLSAAMAAVAGLAVGVGYGPRAYRWWQERDPDFLQQRGQAREKASDAEGKKGDTKASLKDLKDACDDYIKAAARMSRNHMSGADKVYMHAASLAETISKTSDSQEDAVQYYQRALSLWTSARRENPRNLEVHQKLMDEEYQNVLFGPPLANYPELEETATALLKISDSPEAKIHLAEAKLARLGQNLSKTAPTDEFDKVITLLDGVLKDNPKSGEALALRGRAQRMRAYIAAAQVNVETDLQRATDPNYQKAIAQVRQELTDYLKNYDIQADVAVSLASIAEEEYSLAIAVKRAAATQKASTNPAETRPVATDASRPGSDSDLAKRDEAVSWLEKAYAADPSKEYIGNDLGELYFRIGAPDKAEALYKQMLARDPEKPLGYARLGDFYMTMGKTDQAIEAFKSVGMHNSRGSFRDSYQNDQLQRIALFNIAWLQLDMAQKNGATTEAGKAALKESADYTDKLRATNPIKGILDLLDGRQQLLNRNYTQAISTLHNAEGTLNNQRTLSYFAKTELLLADANIAVNQPGIAIELIDKAFDTQTLDGSQRLISWRKKGMLLVQVGRFSEAVQMMDALLGTDDKTGVFRNADKIQPEFLATLVDIRSRAKLALSGSSASTDDRATVLKQMRESGDVLQLALIELGGDDEAALTDAMSVLAKKESNTDAQNQMAYQVAITAHIRLNHKDEARKLADQALAAFPKSAAFQRVKAELDLPGDPNSPEAQKRVIATITDDYVRESTLGSLSASQNQYDDAIAAFKKAEAAVSDNSPENKDKYAAIVDRIFSVALYAAEKSAAADKQKHFYDIAQEYANIAERGNLDSVNGKLFQGRLQFSRSKGREGVQILEQAVAQRPDYAIARVALGQKYYQLGTELGTPDTRQHNMDAALEQIREAIRLAPNNLTALQYAIDLLLRKGDSTSRNEAEGYIKTGQALAPDNQVFAAYNDLIANDPRQVAEAIRLRETMYERDKNDLNNLHRLSALYVRNKQPKKAIEKVAPVVEANPKEFGLVDLLARLYGEAQDFDTALKLYGPFLDSANQDERYAALMSEADLFKKMPDKVREAATAYQEAAKLEPAKSDDAERRWGDMYFEKNYYVEAEAVYNAVIAKAVDANARDRVIWRLIETQLRQNTPEKIAAADKLLADALRARPDDKQGLILRAFAHILHNDVPSAIVDLDRVLRLDPSNVSAMYYRALAHVNQHKIEDAIQDLVAARAVQRDSVDVRMLLADLYRQTQQYGEADIEYSELIDLHPELARIRLAYVTFLMELAKIEAKLPTESDDETVIAIRVLHPSDKLDVALKDASTKFESIQWWLMYCELQTILGNNEIAHRYYKSFYERPQYKPVLDLADAYFASFLSVGDYKGAIDIAPSLVGDVEKSLGDYPQFASVYISRAKAQLQLNNQSEAARDLDKALSIAIATAKKSKDYSLYLAFVAKAMDAPAAIPPGVLAGVFAARAAADPEELIARIAQYKMLGLDNKVDEALSIANSLKLPAEDKALRMIGLRERSVLELRAKQYAAAEKDYQEILQLNPDDVESLNNYAYMVADFMHQPDKGMTYAKRALDVLNTRSTASEVASLKATVLDTLGWIQYLHGDNDLAIETIRRASKMQPIPSSFLHLAYAYKKAGQLDQARHFASEGKKFAIAAKDTESLPELTSLSDELDKAAAKTEAPSGAKMATTQKAP